MQMRLPLQVERILDILNANGYEAYAVGGCVRDLLLGREPKDWDITTSARPKQVKSLFPRTVDTGIQHGTITVLMDGKGYEVTTYRIDGEYEDGRHPSRVEYTANLLEDLKRRDFTINAMAYRHDVGVVDAFGGREDLEKKSIRCVGDAIERFTEDALRILRAIRFSAQLGFSVEEKTWEAIGVIAPNLAKVSKERIQVELSKTLLSGHPEQMGGVFEQGVSGYISPAFARIPWGQIRIPASLPARKYVRWAALLRQTDPEEAVRVLKDLKMDNGTVAKVKTLLAWSGKEVQPEPAPVRRAMGSMEAEVWDALLDFNAYGPRIRSLTRQIREKGDCLDLKHLAVNGQDLIDAGMKPGRELGQILNRLLDMVLECPEKNRKEALLEIGKAMGKG